MLSNEDAVTSDLSQSEIDLDVMMREIRAEVARRKAIAGTAIAGPAGSVPSQEVTTPPTAMDSPAFTRLPVPAGILETKDRYKLADFLQFHDEAFVSNAYLGILRRAPDGTGFAEFLNALREGRRAKTEILGRMRFSREGRALGVAVKGLPFAFALRTLRRVPVIGRVLGIIQYAIRLPDIVRNHERLEAVVFHRDLQVRRHINAVESQVEGAIGTLGQRVCVIDARIAQTLARLDTHDRELLRIASVLTGIEIGLREHQRHVTRLLQSSGNRAAVGETTSDEREQAFAAFYVDFQNRFRGTTEDIRSRLAVYLPVVKAAGIGTSGAPLVDLGSGRGEWLLLLKEQGLTARGVDTNHAMAAVCREQMLEVIEADAAHYLKALPPESVGGITAFHLVEHVCFTDLLTLFHESLRVLRPGGLLIFETPNPENLVVGACNFHIDPTHQRPLPPTMLSFIAEARGFERVETRRLHPSSGPTDADGSPVLPEMVETLLYGPQDYAIIAYKPGGAMARPAEAHHGSDEL